MADFRDDNSVSGSSVSSTVDDSDPISIRTKIKRDITKASSKFSITFEKFRDLPSDKGRRDVLSSKFACFGHEWRLRLLLGDYRYPKPPKGMVGLFLERCNRSGKFPNLKISYEIKSTDGSVSIQTSSDKPSYYSNSSSICDLATRSDIKHRFLHEGALTVSVIMELKEFIPKNPLAATMLKLFRDEESSDVIFEVLKEEKGTNKKRKRGNNKAPSTVQFHAHRFILENTSSELAALCESSPEEGLNSPILINDIKADVFCALLYYIYGGDIANDEFLKNGNGKDLIDAADKLGVVNLKLEAEVWYVHSTRITTDNVIDNLLYADAKNLALLKEAVMDYIVKNKKKVMKRVSFEAVPGDIYKDLLAAVSRVLEDSDEDDSDDEQNEEKDDYASMGIGALRRKLDERGIDIDGSRDMLIAALKKRS